MIIRQTISFKTHDVMNHKNQKKIFLFYLLATSSMINCMNITDNNNLIMFAFYYYYLSYFMPFSSFLSLITIGLYQCLFGLRQNVRIFIPSKTNYFPRSKLFKKFHCVLICCTRCNNSYCLFQVFFYKNLKINNKPFFFLLFFIQG